MDDDLNCFENGRRSKFIENGRRLLFFVNGRRLFVCEWKKTNFVGQWKTTNLLLNRRRLFFLSMEVDQFLASGK